jgi:NhaP-type Na+/H+ or K+/H+ antiporter
MAPATKNILLTIGIGIAVGLAVQVLARMLFKKKQNPDGTTSTKFLGFADLDGALTFKE